MKVYTLRHGESEWNARRKICGMVDAPLTKKGWDQAREAARELEARQGEYQIRHILVSPLLRARQTASLIEQVLHLKAEIEPRIHEIAFGDLEGIDFQDPRYLERRTDPYARFPGGESLLDVAVRVYQVLDELPARFGGENVLLVCHGMMGRVVATYFQSYTAAEFRDIHIPNCQFMCYDMRSARNMDIPIQPYQA